jgi:hypothetical protein
MALGSIRPLTEMSTRRISGNKGGRCVRLTTLPPSCAAVIKSGNRNFLEHSWPLQACKGTALPIFIGRTAQEDSLTLEEGWTYSSEAPKTNYTPTLRNMPEERIFHYGFPQTLVDII